MKKKYFILPIIGLAVMSSVLIKNNIKEADPMERIKNVSVVAATSEDVEHPAAMALAESFGESWIAAGKENQSLTIELPKIKRLTQVTQIFNEDDIWYFKIEASLDGKQYFDLLDNSFGVYGKVFTEGVAGIAKFVRLNVIKSEKGLTPSSTAFYCFGEDLEAGTNVVVGAKATSSSSAPGLVPQNIFDDNNSTFWCASSGNYPQTVQGLLQEPVYVKELALTWNDYGSYVYNLSIQNTDGSWENIADYFTLNGTKKNYELNKAIIGVKYEVLGGPGWANLTEIKLNGFRNIVEKVEETTDLGCASFISHIDNASTVKYSLDGKTFEPISSLTNANVVARYLKGIEQNTKVYGTKFSEILNVGFRAKVSSYLDETHDVRKAFISNESADYKNSYYSSATKGEKSWIELDLGKKCIIDRIYQEFNEEAIHSFEIEGSLDGKNYELIIDAKEGSKNSYSYDYQVDNKEYRYIRLRMYPAKDQYATSRAFYVYGNSSPKADTWWLDHSGVIRFYPKRWPITFKEIESQLDDFRYAGYRIIELHQPYEGLGDIWAGLGSTNFYQADPICGSNEDLTHLLDVAHSKGIKIFMFGNVGYGKYNADYFLKACRDYAMGINSKERNWFLFSDTCPNPSQWFWSDVANAYYYCYWDPARGTIPTYNFSNIEWQEETFKYIDYWSNFGFDGIALDAPDAYYFGSAERKSVTIRNITHILKQKNMMSLPEGSGNTDFIASYNYEMVQNYNMSSWGAGARSLSLEASLNHTVNNFEENIKNSRDVAVGMGGSSMAPMNFEDRYDMCTGVERIMEASLVTTTGYMAFLHSGQDSKMGQDIMLNWDPEIQYGVHKAFALQNSMSSLNPSGERVTLSTDSSTKYYAFYRTNSKGTDISINLFNYSNAKGEMRVSLANTPFDGMKEIKLYDAFNYEEFDLTISNNTITVPVNANSHRTLILR